MTKRHENERYEKIRIKPEHESILRALGRLLDPLNIIQAFSNAIKTERFYLDEAFNKQRENLRHFLDKFIPIKIEDISDNILKRVVKILNLSFKSFEIEFSVDGVKRIIIKLYPNRKHIHEHRLVLDTLADM